VSLNRPEILIVGGGLAGGAAAAQLAQAGARVRLLEREAGAHDKVCGEFLSGEAQLLLARLGLDPQALGGAPISRVRLVDGPRSAEAALPFAALGLSRRRLDEALLGHAASLGAQVTRGLAARRIACGRVETSQGELSPTSLLLASGKHEVRGARREAQGAIDGYIGFKMHFRVRPAARADLQGLVEVSLLEGGYAGLQLVDDGVANLCLLVTRERFAALGRTWESLFASLLAQPHLARRLDDATAQFERPATIAAIPYGFVHAPRAGDPQGLFRLGDQAAVIPSFCGDGQAIALHSGRLAAQMLSQGAGASAYHARLRRDVARQVALAIRLQRLCEAAPGRAALLALAGLAPALLTLAAAWTRIPARAIAA
jgi:flavin-dependent dehydrogenase